MTRKLSIILLLIALIPHAIVLFGAQGTALILNPQFQEIQAISLAVSLLIALSLPGITVQWMVTKNLAIMRNLCVRVKQGHYSQLLGVPNEPSSNEDELIQLMRDMNWMAHRIGVRERELQQAIQALANSQKKVDEQNQYLTAVNKQLLEAQQQLEKQAMTDPLTNIANRRCFFNTLNHQFAGCSAHSMSLLILDIDHFKLINDNYGHQSGDLVLKEVARLIQENIRTGDLAARIGGEEYAILLGNTEAEGAALLAHRLQSIIEKHSFAIEAGKEISVTVSIGVCAVKELPCCHNVENLYGFADKALYFCKNNGRNCIAIYRPESGAIAKLA